MVLFKGPWEHRTRKDQQLALAGSTPHEEYLENRLLAAEHLRSLLAIEPHHRGFEIGSGDGIVARELSGHCAQLACTDISRSFLKLARATCSRCSNVSFHRIRKQYLSFLATGEYDFGFSMNVFIHFHVYEAYFYLREVRRLLTPGGSFLFSMATLGDDTMPLFHVFAERYRRLRVVKPGFMRWYDLPTVRALVAEADLEIDEDRLVQTGGHLKIVVRPKGAGEHARSTGPR